jgi:CP family cyanate transporter-like MFS transporter
VAAAGRPAARSAEPGTAKAAGAASGGGALLIAGILALAFNLRAAITGLPPIFPELSAAGLSPATEAVLAATPVLCFAGLSAVAPWLARRFGEERVLGLAAVLIAAGLGLRAAGPGVLLFPGTIIASSAIALMNVLLPSLIKRRRPDQIGLLIGLYLLSLIAGAVVAAAIAVPVFAAVAGGARSGTSAAVRLTLGMWAVPALAAALVWLPQLRLRVGAGERWALSPGGGVMKVARRALAWQVMAYMGLQSLSYYATLSWFPTMFRDHGIGAAASGNLVALMTAGNAVTGLVMPVLAQRARDQRLLSVAAVAAIMVGTVGSAFGPNATVIGFVAVLGLGQGAAFGLAVFLFTARAADGRTAAALSGFAQGGGYLIAATGPLLIGLLHTATGGWAVPAGVLLVVAVGQLAAGLLAGRNRQLSLDGP